MEKFFFEHEAAITMLCKIFATLLGVGLFTRFIYNFTVKYFENLTRDVSRIKAFIWGPDGRPEKGLEHRLTDLERSHKDRLESGQCRKKK